MTSESITKHSVSSADDADWEPAPPAQGSINLATSVGSIVYFKRFKMEFDLDEHLPQPTLPTSYSFVAWEPALLEAHAHVLFESFLDGVDAHVFPAFTTREGCQQLMREISKKSGFLPEATWLLLGPTGPCGTVQGIFDRSGMGGIQNLGIVPAQRGRGLGEMLLLRALQGFYRRGLGRAVLEVTAQNASALKLYRRLGFRKRKVIYKAVSSLTQLG